MRRAVLALGLLILFAASGRQALAQSQPAEDQQSILAKVISRVLSSPEGLVRIGAIDGALTSDAMIRDIVVSDRDGPWLRIDRTRIIWRRAALLLRRLEVDRLDIGRIEVLRRPAASDAPQSADEPLVPELPVKLEIKALTVQELVLSAEVAGAGARLSITGRASLGKPADGLDAELTARRLDAEGESRILVKFVPKGELLDLVVGHREAAGGLIGHLIDIPDRPPVVLDLKGQGPLDSWNADLAFAAGTVASARGTARILKADRGRRADLDLSGNLEGLLPPLAATIFAGTTRVSGQVDLADAGGMTLHGLSLASSQAEVTLKGTLSADDVLAMRLEARALPRNDRSDTRIAALRTLTMAADVTGPMSSPVIKGRLETEISRLDAFSKDLGQKVSGTARVIADVSGTPLDRMVDASLTLTASNLGFANHHLATLIGAQAVVSATASMRGERISLAPLTVKSRRIDIGARGALDRQDGRASGTATLAGKLDGRPLTGEMRFATAPDGALEIPSFTLKLAGAQLAGSLASAAKGILTGSVRANIPDLSHLGGSIGVPLRGALTLDATLSGAGGRQQADIKTRGRNLSASGVRLASFDATARLNGELTRPNGAFTATIAGIQHQDLQRTGVARLDVRTSGQLASDHALVQADIKGGPSLALKAAGALPFGPAGKLDIKVTGSADAALANAQLSGGVQRVTGKISIDGAVRGTAGQPLIEGGATLSNGTFSDLVQGIRLTGMRGRIVGAGSALRIEGLTAATQGGGTISITGTVQADPARGMPADLRVTGTKAKLVDNGIVDLVAGLDLAVTGPLTQGPRVTGRIDVISLDVTIPDKLPADIAPLANARHLSPPEATRERLRLASLETDRDRKRKSGIAGTTRMAIDIHAPSHIFVRGRGVDAELGGDISVSGSPLAPRANGAFELRRGRINMLTQRLEFSRGRLTFAGDILPELDFVAATTAGGVTAKVSVTGRADAPAFALTSEPQLPPDEVLSRLMFERAVGSLSPLQAVQLAQAVARLTGRGGPDFLDKTRQALGVDTLDVNVGKDGPTVGASRYISRNIRLGIKAGAQPDQSGVTTHIDLGRRIRLQGEQTIGGKTSIGIGAEIEY